MQEIERIGHLLGDEKVTDVLIDSASRIHVERDGSLTQVNEVFADETDLKSWIHSVISGGGGRLDLAQPLSEVSLFTDFGLLRVHAVLAGQCSPTTKVSIRRHPAQSLSLQELQSKGAISQEQLNLLQWILSSKENYVIVGGTGAGKTTLLRALLNEVASERIITLEENYELQLPGNSIALQTRENNQEGVGSISLTTLLRNALRMRPDRIVIGEARGEELLLLLQSLNTGHNGAGFTLHANSQRDALPRMIGILNFSGVSSHVASALIASAIQWVIEVRRTSEGRKVVAIERLHVEL